MELFVVAEKSAEEIRRIVDPQNRGTVAVTGEDRPGKYCIVVSNWITYIAVKARLITEGITPIDVEEYDDEDDQETDQYGNIIEW